MADRFRLTLYRLRGLFRRPITLGAQCVVIDTRERVLLVRQTYMRGWQFPGGGVDPGESAEAAARRETEEETGLAPTGPAHLHGLFFNRALDARDHVAVFVIRGHPCVEGTTLQPAAGEIAAAEFFPLSDLPADLTGGTARRIAEIVNGTPPAVDW